MSDPALARLRRIADVRLDARLAALRKAAGACSALTAELESIAEKARAARAAEWSDPRAASRFEIWADARRRVLNVELARRLAERESLRGSASLAFGQAEALRAIDERIAAESAALRRRRSGT